MGKVAKKNIITGEKRTLKRWGDRRGARLVRGISASKKIIPFMFPSRCDNEVFFNEEIELTNLNAYIATKEAGYVSFHFVVTAFVKMLIKCPELNRFIQNKKLYQRDELVVSFAVEKACNEGNDCGASCQEHADEIAFFKFDDTATIENVRTDIDEGIDEARNADNGDCSFKILDRLPRFILRFLVRIINFFDIKGILPRSVTNLDMNYSSICISNIGSSKFDSGYHNLCNRGTNSIYAVIGEKKLKTKYDINGNVELCEVLPFGITVDGRIADSSYLIRSFKLFRQLLENPHELEQSENKNYEAIDEIAK